MPISSITTARNDILTLFTTAWNAQTPPVPLLLYQDDRQDIPQGTESWARVLIQHNVFTQVTVGGKISSGGGGRRFRRVGLVTVQIFTPFGDGLRQADVLAKVALDAFEGVDTADDAIEFKNTTINEIGQSGAWYQTNVLTEFEYDEIK